MALNLTLNNVASKVGVNTATPTAVTPAVGSVPAIPQVNMPPTPPPNPVKTPTGGAAVSNTPNNQVAFSFLDGSGYNSQGVMVKPPTVVTAKAATADLAKKQSDLALANIVMGTQAQVVATNKVVTDANATANGAINANTQALTDATKALNPTDAATQTNNDLATNQAKQDASYQQFQNQITQLQNGTFPLTVDQQAQVNSLQQQFDQLRQAQQLANKNYEGGTVNAGIASGRNRYAPEIELGNIQAAVSAGIQKIANIDAQAAGAIAQLKQGFMDNNYKLINASYTAASDFFKQKSDTIQQMSNNVRNAANDALAQHQSDMADQKFELEKRTAARDFAIENGVTQPFYLVGNTAINSETGEPVSFPEYLRLTGQPANTPQEEADFSKIQSLRDPDEHKAVLNLMDKYGDAGILPIDSLSQATAKLRNSALYHKDTYIAPVGGGNAGLDTILKTLQVQNLLGGTDAQRTAAGYADRILQSGQIIDDVQSSISSYNPIGFTAQENLPNALKSSVIQQYEQAARNFINAVLRRESGAAINKDEYTNAYQQYLPRPGDSDEVLIQKKQNRDTQFANLTRDAGNAASKATSTNGGGQIIEYNGKRYQTDADGNFDPNKPL